MFSAVLDTNVLYPSLLRDLLLELAWNKVYRPVWSAALLDELADVIRRKTCDNPGNGVDSDLYIGRLISRMNTAFPDALVVSVARLKLDLPDPDDVKVVGCAISGNAELIITNNVKDFPQHSLPRHVQAILPSDFLLDCLDLDPHAFVLSLGAIARRSGKNGLPVTTFHALVAYFDNRWCPGLTRVLKDLQMY